MHIAIPTKGRGPAKQHTYTVLRNAGCDVTLYCPKQELDDFLAAGFSAQACPASGIGAVRQWIVDNSPEDAVLMMDDDLKQWSVRPDPEVGIYRKASTVDITNLIEYIADTLEYYAHVGIGHRQYANVQPPRVFCNRAMRAFGVRRDIMQRHNIRFLPLVEDIEVIIQFIRAGYANCIDYTVVHDQTESNAPGGCSSYRTLAYHNEWVAKVVERHSPYVVMVDKTTKGGWFNGLPRKEVKVMWKRLVEDFNPQPIAKVQHAA